MQEEITNAAGSLLRFLVGQLLWGIVLFNLGRGALLLITWGRYPNGADLDRHEDRISFAGVLVLLALWSAVAVTNRFAVE